MQRRLITVDLLAGLGALLLGVLGLLLRSSLGLDNESSGAVMGAALAALSFAPVALGRWYRSLTGQRRATDDPAPDHVIERWSDESVPIDIRDEPANGDPSGPTPEAS